MCDAFQSTTQFLAEEAHVRFAKHFEMPAFDFTDVHSSQGAVCPAHLWIANAKVRLAGSLKQEHRSVKARSLEVLPRPIRVPPAISVIYAIARNGRYPPANCPAHGSPLLIHGKSAQSSKSLVIVVDGPQRANLGILKDPGIKNSKQCYLFAFRFQLENNVLCDQHPETHGAQAVGSVGLYRSHRRDVLLRQCLHFLPAKRMSPEYWSGGL